MLTGAVVAVVLAMAGGVEGQGGEPPATTEFPTTAAPTAFPTTAAPAAFPTAFPTTKAPTPFPTTKTPTASPTKQPTIKPTMSPTTSPTKSPSHSPTFRPTNAPTPCTSKCPPGKFNVAWREDASKNVCSTTPQCQDCPPGSYKNSGNSWTPCLACGDAATTYCSGGALFTVLDPSVCTYRGSVLREFPSTGRYKLERVATPELELGSYDESMVRDSAGACGRVEVVDPAGLSLSIVRPASSVASIELRNPGDLPVLIASFSLPEFVLLFDDASGSGVASMSLVVEAKKSTSIKLLVMSASIKKATASGTVKFTVAQVVPSPNWVNRNGSFPISVSVSEPVLSVLPASNTWSMNIGTVERHTLSIYNMQVKSIDYEAAVQYQVGAPSGWIVFQDGSDQGTLDQGFACTKDGVIIGTDGVNKAEITFLVNATDLIPGTYSAAVVVSQKTVTTASVKSLLRVEVLPGKVQASQSTFSFVSSGNATSVVAPPLQPGGPALPNGRLLIGGSGMSSASSPVVVRLPFTQVSIVPRDSFGIATTQMGSTEVFEVSWARVDEPGYSGTIFVMRNVIDNSFVGNLGIRQTGIYSVSIRLGQDPESAGSFQAVKGSPFLLEVLPLSCATTPFSEPHPLTGYTCVCSAGYGADEATGGCNPCPSGQFRRPDMVTVTPFCRACDPGTFSSDPGSRSCKFCGEGRQPDPDRASCSLCPENAVVDVSSPSRRCVPCGPEYTVVNFTCTCRPEYFLERSAANKCTACPRGAFCGFGDATTILPEHGYWRASWNPLAFIRCPNADACEGVNEDHASLLKVPETWTAFLEHPEEGYQIGGGSASSGGSGNEKPTSLPPVSRMNGCAEGFTGPLCKECAPGFYPVGSLFSCSRCDDRGRTILLLVVSLLVGVGALTYLIVRTIRARGVPRRKEVMVLKIVLGHLQIIALTKRFPLEWPPAVLTMMSVFDVLSSAGSSALSTHCLFYAGANTTDLSTLPFPLPFSDPDSLEDLWRAFAETDFGLSDWVFLSRALTYALSPVFLIAFFVLVWRVIVPLYRDTSGDSLTGKEKAVVSAIVTLIVLHPFLTRAGFEFFSCSEAVDGHSFLEAQYTIQCWEGAHAQWLVLGGFILGVYAVGIPLYATFVLYCIVRKEAVKQAQAQRWGRLRKSIASRTQSLRGVQSRASTPQSLLTELETASSFGQDSPAASEASFVGEPTPSSVSADSCSPLREQLSIPAGVSRAGSERSFLDKWRPIYGFIYSGYRQECFFWEIVIMLRKAAFATISVVLRPVGVDVQTYAGLLVITFSIVLTVQHRPYLEASRLHLVEIASLSISFATLLCGLLIYSPNTGLGFKQFCTLLIVISNLVFFLYIVYVIRATLAESISKVAQTVSYYLCCKFRSKSVDIKRVRLPREPAASVAEGSAGTSKSKVPHPALLSVGHEFQADEESEYDADSDNEDDGDQQQRNNHLSSSFVGTDVDHGMDLSYRLQDEADRLRDIGDIESASRLTMEAAAVAAAALKVRDERLWNNMGDDSGTVGARKPRTSSGSFPPRKRTGSGGSTSSSQSSKGHARSAVDDLPPPLPVRQRYRWSVEGMKQEGQEQKDLTLV